MQLHAIDLIIIVAYLVGVVVLGWHFSRKQKDLRDYFLSDREVPWWALAASIVATETSVVTFISVPAFAFAANARGEGGNFTFMQLVLGYMAGRFLIVAMFIPLYFRGELFTVYQILDRRFGGPVKRVAASLFIITRSLSDGVRLFAIAIPLVALTGWADWKSILIIGVVMIAFTYLGGITAVIWIEVIQLLIYNLGAILAGLMLLNLIQGGWSEVIEAATEAGKFRFFDFTTDIARSYTFWAGVIGGAFLTTSTHGTDQYMVQRYLCSRDSRQAIKALLGSGVIVFVQFLMFLLIGVMLSVFYNRYKTLPADIGPDRVFSHFIVNELPAGVIGLVIAAMIAAAMSSSLNALASTSITDFYKPLVAPNRSEAHYVRASRMITTVWGAAQIGAALYMIGKDQRIVDTVLSIASFTNGPILGLFFLSTLTRRVKQAGALTGVITGIAVMIFVWARLAVSWQWYVLIGSMVTFVVGYAASLMGERKQEVVEQAAD
ncbi:MAG TPA: sodium:solute symporter [Blastocatellia bacterium]|nr:sodium:solute symporter [Blastocatellia bacterium]